jgi:hypothetical protein
MRGGTVVLAIEGKTVSLRDEIKLAEKQSAGLVKRREDLWRPPYEYCHPLLELRISEMKPVLLSVAHLPDCTNKRWS